MANVKISELPVLTSVGSSDLTPIIQGGVTYASSAQDIVGGGLSFEIVADGSIGGPFSTSFYSVAVIPANTTGTTKITPQSGPSVYVNADYAPFTAQNVSFTTSTFMYGISILNSGTLQTISAPLLENSNGGLDFSNCYNLTTMDFPSLTLVNSAISFGNNVMLSTINFPLLEIVSLLNINFSDPGITGFRQSMFPSLRKASFSIGYNYLPSFEIDFPLLTDLTNNTNGSSASSLTQINLPALVNIYYYQSLSDFFTLTNVILGAVGVTKKWGGSGMSGTSSPNVYFQSCALNQTSVDNILMVLASLDGTNGTTYTANGTIILSGGSNSSPSSSGTMVIMTLQSRGFYVSTN
jgi:hypothetical protein